MDSPLCGALLEGHFRLVCLGTAQRRLSAMRARAPASATCGDAGRGRSPTACASSNAADGVVARAWRDRHRPGGRTRAWRARDLRGAAGRHAHAPPRLHARARPSASSSSRTWSRPPGSTRETIEVARTAGARSWAPRRSSTAATGPTDSTFPSSLSVPSIADMGCGGLPALSTRHPCREARIACVTSGCRARPT